MVGQSIAGGVIMAIEYWDELTSPKSSEAFGDISELLNPHHKGFCLNGADSLSLLDSYRNVLIEGTTGAGKGVFVLIPSILHMTGASIIAHDPSGELATKTSGYLHAQGYKVKVLNFSNPSVSDSFNPMDYIKTQSDINKLASLLVRTTLASDRSDPFWNLEATSFLKTFIGLVLTQEKQYRNLANVKHLISVFAGSPKKVDSLVAKHATDELLKEYKSIISKEAKILSSVVSTVTASLQLFEDQDICKTTSYSTIDFESIRKEKTVIYIQNQTADAKYYAPLISIFFEMLMKSLMSKLPDKRDLDTFLLIDEAATLTVPILALALANVRKYRAGILTAWQSEQQIHHTYGASEAISIKDNSLTKFYFTGAGLATCEELSKTLGTVKQVTAQGKSRMKPLLSPQEIRTLKPTEAIIVSGARKPFKVHMTPYFKQPLLVLKTQERPYQILNQHLQSDIPLIPFS
jgi:type IV secretion system protein VirD4